MGTLLPLDVASPDVAIACLIKVFIKVCRTLCMRQQKAYHNLIIPICAIPTEWADNWLFRIHCGFDGVVLSCGLSLVRVGTSLLSQVGADTFHE